MGFDLELLQHTQHMHEMFSAPRLADFECEHGAIPEDERFPEGCGCWDVARRVRACGPGGSPSTDFEGAVE